MKRIILLHVLLFSEGALLAQETNENKAEFKLGAYYNSALNYYGRTDSLQSSGFFPVAELWVNKSFYINAAPVFVINNTVSMDYAGTVATIGYRFAGENKVSGNFYLVKPFYETSSQLVQSALKAQVAGLLSSGTKLVNFNGGADIKFSDKVDYGLTGGLDKLIKFTLNDKSVFVLNPSAYVNAGTQHFTETYFKQSSFVFFPGPGQVFTEEVSRFKILSYEFSMPVILGVGKFQVIGIPAYVIPQNLVIVPGRPDLSERGKSRFYATIGAKVNF